MLALIIPLFDVEYLCCGDVGLTIIGRTFEDKDNVSEKEVDEEVDSDIDIDVETEDDEVGDAATDLPMRINLERTPEGLRVRSKVFVARSSFVM